MGIIFVSVTTPDEVIQELHNNPPLIWRWYAPEEDEFYLQEIGAIKKPNFISRILGAKEVPIPETLPSFEQYENQKNEIDLDKSWDGINFCLKKNVPAGTKNIFEDGNQIGKIEVGYGPATSFTSSEIREIHQIYSAVTNESLLNAYDPKAMGHVYPKAIWQEESSENREYIEENFKTLCNQLKTACDNNLGIVVVYT